MSERDRIAGPLDRAIEQDDQAALAELARTDGHVSIRRKAVAHLRDEAFRHVVANSDPNSLVRAKAIEGITDRDRLADIAWKNAMSAVAGAAVQRLADMDVLRDLSTRHPNANVRRKAVERLDILRAAAVERHRAALAPVKSQPELERLARTSADTSLRAAAVERLDEERLWHVIESAEVALETREAATRRTRDMARLEQLARTDRDAAIRLAAVRSLDEEHLWRLIADATVPLGTRLEALRRATDQQRLENVARMHPDRQMRIIAAGRLTNRVLLIDVIEHERDPGVQALLVTRLLDEVPDFAAHLAPPDRYSRTPTGEVDVEAAVRKIAVAHPEATVRSAAQATLARRSFLAVSDNDLAQLRVEVLGPGDAAQSPVSSEDHLDDFQPERVASRTPPIAPGGPPTVEPVQVGTGATPSAAPGEPLPEALLGAKATRSADEPSPGDLTVCSLYAPPQMARGGSIVLQAFLHLPASAEEAEKIAREADPTAGRRAFRSLESPIERGTRVHLKLDVPKLVVDEPLQSVIWQGRTESIQFGLTAPADLADAAVTGKLMLIVGSVPIGHVMFRLGVTAEGVSVPQPQGLGEDARHYKLVFVSYASENRNEVLKRVQMMAIFKQDFFQDLLSLDPGERWEKKLYEKIDECDLFLLFWSTAARDSVWVMKEARYALASKHGDPDAPPEIIPVIIEGPPPVTPPDDLKHLHFNDPITYFMR